jgi:hypothetical protein
MLKLCESVFYFWSENLVFFSVISTKFSNFGGKIAKNSTSKNWKKTHWSKSLLCFVKPFKCKCKLKTLRGFAYSCEIM